MVLFLLRHESMYKISENLDNGSTDDRPIVENVIRWSDGNMECGEIDFNSSLSLIQSSEEVSSHDCIDFVCATLGAKVITETVNGNTNIVI